MLKTDPRFSNLKIVDHPVINHQLSILRDKKSDHVDYKEALRMVCAFIAPYLTEGLATKDVEIETPLETMTCQALSENDPVIVPILRAGLGLSEPLKDLLPFAKSGHIGVYRDAETHEPVEYLVKLPNLETAPIYLVDPMLATGHSAKFALDCLVKRGANPENIKMMILVAAPEGVQCIQEAYPQVEIFTAALDRQLNENAYILPGLGDAGDRLFGTL